MKWIAVVAVLAMAHPAAAGDFHAFAPTPPMGWNSWDSFGATINEEQLLANARIIEHVLKPHGWDTVTIDVQWYEPGATGFDYRKDAVLTMDASGRLIPAPNRFPSSAGGAGFKPLADEIHGLGLKFGLHLMRGIPRQAVERNLPVLGTNVRVADIADTHSICPWNQDMYGVDMSKPGAQAYYDSVFALFASWGVDFVKVDDMSRPYEDHIKEIEAVRLAIDRSGRAMVLSLSPGETPIAEAQHVAAHANMWRISDDFWDNWPALKEQFARLGKWNTFRAPGAWPDADMLPLGTLALGARRTNFSPAEQRTLMTLWAIARSPLIFGGDARRLDRATRALLTNDDVIAVDQASTNNRPVFDRDGIVAWTADAPGTAYKYLALFNTRDALTIDPHEARFTSPVITRATPGRAVDVDVDVRGAALLVLSVGDGGDGLAYDHAVWAEPRLVMADGSERKLTSLTWRNASAGYGIVSRDKGPNAEALAANGAPIADGISAHAPSSIAYKLPRGAVRFHAWGILNDSADAGGSTGGTVQFFVYALPASAEDKRRGVPVAVSLSDLGLRGPVRARDLWAHSDIGVAREVFAPSIPWHGAGLYRLSPVTRASR